jgi:hypothetical protein
MPSRLFFLYVLQFSSEIFYLFLPSSLFLGYANYNVKIVF